MNSTGSPYRSLDETAILITFIAGKSMKTSEQKHSLFDTRNELFFCAKTRTVDKFANILKHQINLAISGITMAAKTSVH
jgi:hypothetical protein